MNIIEFLNKNNILWFPIDLNVNNGKKIPSSKHYKIDYNDFINKTREEIIDRQKYISESDYIGIDTNIIHQIDVDTDPEKYEYLKKDYPYFGSVSKGYPHFFVKFDKNEQKLFKYRHGDVLTGQWSYCKANEQVFNYETPINKFYSCDLLAPIVKKTKKVIDPNDSEGIKSLFKTDIDEVTLLVNGIDSSHAEPYDTWRWPKTPSRIREQQ